MVETGPPALSSNALEFFAGDSEMARLMKGFDWSKTSLGAPESWPQSLKTAVRIILTSRFSMWLAWGPDLVFFYNDAYRHDTLGLKHPRALGQTFAEVWAEVLTDLGPRVEMVLKSGVATWDEALQLFLERSGFPEETYHTFSYSPLANDEGQVSGLLCVVTEVTERVIGERRLALLRDLGEQLGTCRTEQEVLDSTKDLFCARPQDVPFQLTYLFDSFGRTARLACASGVEPGDELAPESIDLDHGPYAWPLIQLQSSGGQIVLDNLTDRYSEIPCGPWDRSPKQAVVVPIAQPGIERLAGFLVIGVNPYRRLDGSYEGFIDLLAGQIASGLANVRAYEAERRRAEELAKLDKAKTTFFSNVSHELRTPLTLMIGPLEDLLAKSGAVPLDTRGTIELAHRNSKRLLKLVNTLLEFSRLEAGRSQANFERVDLGAYTADIASSFRSVCDQAGLRFSVKCAAHGEPVYVDRGMWEKIVLNLVSNAIKFTFEGEIEIVVRQEGSNAILSVRDTGTGISEDALPHIFERFYRVDGAHGRTHEGTGIGLALVRELVELHGGKVSVESELGMGSQFSATVPLGRDHLPADRVVAHRNGGSESISDAFVGETFQWLRGQELIGDSQRVDSLESSNARILLVDDNADLRQYLDHLLSEKYVIEMAANGAEALVVARLRPPDLILTDVMMPVLDGFGLLKEVRNDPALCEVPVIMLSARAGEEAKVEGLEFGADDYLIKPFSARELLARVHSNLELNRLRKLTSQREEKLRVEAENAFERMKKFAASLPQMVSERDSSGRLRWANDQFYAYTGLPPGTFPGEEGREIVHPLDRDRYEKGWAETLRTGQNLRIEMRLRRHDGEMRWWLITSVAIRDSEGKIERFYTSSTDIHDQKETEYELERRVEERTAALVEANEEMEGFTYTVSHDLRSPLRSIIFNSNLLLEQIGLLLTDNQRQLLERQDQAAKRLANLIDDLLKLSRISRQQLAAKEFDLSEIAESVVAELRKDSKAPCEVSIEPGMKAVGDPQLLQFVLLNLVENACKFSPNRGVVAVGMLESEGERRFFVRDSGIGFDTAYADKVFQPFERLVSDKEFPGTGIGLANVKRIVERHHGRVWVESKLGEGATFFFTLGGS